MEGLEKNMEISIISFLDNMVNREISNGIWFLSNCFLLTFLLKFLFPRLWRDPLVWRAELEVKLAWAFTLVIVGSTIRSGWIWVLLAMEYHHFDTTAIKSISVITFIAIGIAIWGTVCLIKALTIHDATGKSDRWLWMSAVGVSVTVPLLAHFAF